MKTWLTILGLILAGAGYAGAANTRLELPSQKTGTGSHDFYNLGAIIGFDPAEYYIAVASAGKIDLDDVTVSTGDGDQLRMGEKLTYKAFLGRTQLVMLHPTRAQMEKASVQGMSLKLSSKLRGLEFTIPAEQFTVMLRDADRDDIHLRRQRELQAVAARLAAEALANEKTADQLATTASDSASQLTPYRSKGTAKLAGQAFLKTRSGEVRVGAGNVITLVPLVPWAISASDLAQTYSPAKWPPAAREAFLAVVRTTEADASGNFEFTGLPPGEYQMSTTIEWEVASRFGPSSSGGRVTRDVRLRKGESTRAMLTQ